MALWETEVCEIKNFQPPALRCPSDAVSSVYGHWLDVVLARNCPPFKTAFNHLSPPSHHSLQLTLFPVPDRVGTRRVSEFKLLFRHICIYRRQLRYLSLNIKLICPSYKPCARSLSVSMYNVIGCLQSECCLSHDVRVWNFPIRSWQCFKMVEILKLFRFEVSVFSWLNRH